MEINAKSILWPIYFFMFFNLDFCFAGQLQSNTPNYRFSFGVAQFAGRIEDSRLVECSGMDASLTTSNLIWAINDSGDGPFIYALRYDGSSMGRLRVICANNRDWEGLDTFIWRNRPMILIADFGDNQEKHASHTLYIVEEPKCDDNGFTDDAVVEIAWRIEFSYPDRNHDAEGVAVDVESGKVLVLTKRDNPPVLYLLPLIPQKDHVVAEMITAVEHIPSPTAEDRRQKYGKYRSQPTALDISPNGRQAVLLTYKHAYLFTRQNSYSWAEAFSGRPITIPLPLPEDRLDLRQREAICFTPDGNSLMVTSEGRDAAIYALGPQENQKP
jgi:hypothetical protein